MTEADLQAIAALGGKPAELVRSYRTLVWLARKARRLGFVAGEAIEDAKVDQEVLQTSSGIWMMPGVTEFTEDSVGPGPH